MIVSRLRRLHHCRILTTPIAATVSASNDRRSGDSVGIIAAAVTVMLDVLLLFATFESGVVALTEAVFETGPAVDGSVSFSVMVAVPPLAIVPIEHVTGVAPLQLP